MKLKILRTLLFISICHPAMAIQNIEIEDGKKFTAKISKVDANRIKIEGDRIKSIKANANEIEVSVEEKLGEVYVRPALGSSNKPISIFIITEKNRTYQALLFPKSIPSEQIIVRSDSMSLADFSASSAGGDASSYQQQIISLMRAMRSHSRLDGYSIGKSYRKVRLGDLKMKRKFTYKGGEMLGEVYILENSSNKLLIIEEEMFFRGGIRAIKIEKSTLLPDEKTKIFIVS